MAGLKVSCNFWCPGGFEQEQSAGDEAPLCQMTPCFGWVEEALHQHGSSVSICFLGGPALLWKSVCKRLQIFSLQTGHPI